MLVGDFSFGFSLFFLYLLLLLLSLFSFSLVKKGVFEGRCCLSFALFFPPARPSVRILSNSPDFKTELTFSPFIILSTGRSIRPMVLGLRYFVDTYGAMDMLFDIRVEGMGTGRVGTGRLTTV